MTMINLSVEHIKNNGSVLENWNLELANTHFPKVKNLLEEIKANVHNGQINILLNGAANKLDSISSNLKNDLNKVTEFIEMQMTAYRASEEAARERINKVIEKMESLLDEISWYTTEIMAGVGVGSVAAFTAIGAATGGLVGAAVGAAGGVGLTAFTSFSVAAVEYGYSGIFEYLGDSIKSGASNIVDTFKEGWNSIWN